jgi:hypothetical protein
MDCAMIFDFVTLLPSLDLTVLNGTSGREETFSDTRGSATGLLMNTDRLG